MYATGVKSSSRNNAFFFVLGLGPREILLPLRLQKKVNEEMQP